MSNGDEDVFYIHTHGSDDLTLPDVLTRFKVIVLVQQTVSNGWRAKAATRLVTPGCVYMMAWGHDCMQRDDDVDWANLERYNSEIPEGASVMTTWHNDQTLEEVLQFAKHNAVTDMNDNETNQCVVSHITENENGEMSRSRYKNS
jgi:hypothetical protein